MSATSRAVRRNRREQSPRRRARNKRIQTERLRTERLEHEGSQVAATIIEAAGGQTVQAIRFAADPSRIIVTLAVVVSPSLARSFEQATMHRSDASGRRYREVRADRLAVACKLLHVNLDIDPGRFNIRLVSRSWPGLAHSKARLGQQAA